MITVYVPGSRDYGQLSPELKRQLRTIEPSVDRKSRYYPCLAVLKSGQRVDRVYVVDAQSYIDLWGVWPEDDPAKTSLPIGEVAALEESPSRLPAAIANRLYAAGESGMGYSLFTLLFRDGTSQAYATGNAVDFVRLPSGKSAEDITGVLPHKGGEATHRLKGLDYRWCLFGSGESKIPSQRFT